MERLSAIPEAELSAIVKHTLPAGQSSFPLQLKNNLLSII